MLCCHERGFVDLFLCSTHLSFKKSITNRGGEPNASTEKIIFRFTWSKNKHHESKSMCLRIFFPKKSITVRDGKPKASADNPQTNVMKVISCFCAQFFQEIYHSQSQVQAQNIHKETIFASSLSEYHGSDFLKTPVSAGCVCIWNTHILKFTQSKTDNGNGYSDNHCKSNFDPCTFTHRDLSFC